MGKYFDSINPGFIREPGQKLHSGTRIIEVGTPADALERALIRAVRYVVKIEARGNKRTTNDWSRAYGQAEGLAEALVALKAGSDHYNDVITALINEIRHDIVTGVLPEV
jgi:hypothetical protein